MRAKLEEAKKLRREEAKKLISEAVGNFNQATQFIYPRHSEGETRRISSTNKEILRFAQDDKIIYPGRCLCLV